MVAAGEVVVQDVPEPTIVEPTDAIVKIAATCICGSDLWPYRGHDAVHNQHMGHEYVGVVEANGSEVKTINVGDFVVGSFCLSCGECEICRSGYPSRCIKGGFVGGAQSEKVRIPLADGTLVATPAAPSAELIPHLLAASDV